MDTPNDYRRFSQECLRIADEVHSPDLRDRLLRMAQAWLRLARREWLDEGNDVDADTPHWPEGPSSG
jgi:hypothetical protein